MKYMLLVNNGPRGRDWDSLTPEEQQEIYAGYRAVNETP
jgi:hypothetical protein